ncbi:hypothetical protein ACIQB5_44515 [Streptomyces sp. NPDC088560]|uniref:hypothetical protein n=1 Tax=Streptomyces sp. NPDC088560 TaxID=3365868 RepID=UPI00380B223D
MLDPLCPCRTRGLPDRYSRAQFGGGPLVADGLIERRGEDIDAGLQRLTDALACHARHTPSASPTPCSRTSASVAAPATTSR